MTLTFDQPAAAAVPARAAPELLAPAGDFDAMRAAVANGADAVYYGLENFNARHRATNFPLEKLPETIAYLRFFRIELLRQRPHEVAPLLQGYASILRGERAARSAVRSLRVLSQLGVTSGTLDRE